MPIDYKDVQDSLEHSDDQPGQVEKEEGEIEKSGLEEMSIVD